MTVAVLGSDPVFRRLVQLICLILALLLVGTFGYSVLEGWSTHDGFFMTVITMSTVGYGETHQLSEGGRLFTSCLIFLCLLSMTCFTATLTSFIVENDMTGRFQRRRTAKMIAKLRNHTIVCGSGMMAGIVVEQLVGSGRDVVVVDDKPDSLTALRRRYPSLLTVDGSPTSDLILAQASILEAASVVAAMDSELDNLLVSISCKDLGRDVAVYARCNDVSIANRMRKAGVDEVVSPNVICGTRVAEMILA